MKITKLTVSVLLISGIAFLHTLQAQSNPQMDRPIQQCITQQSDDLEVLEPNFSMGYWLGKFVENCEKLQASTGKGGGPQVVALLKMEKDLEELILLADNGCKTLADEKVKTLLKEMKTIYEEKQEVETYKRGQGESNGGLFEEDDELTTMSIPRSTAGKLKTKASKIRKLLEK